MLTYLPCSVFTHLLLRTWFKLLLFTSMVDSLPRLYSLLFFSFLFIYSVLGSQFHSPPPLFRCIGTEVLRSKGVSSDGVHRSHPPPSLPALRGVPPPVGGLVLRSHGVALLSLRSGTHGRLSLLSPSPFLDPSLPSPSPLSLRPLSLSLSAFFLTGI